MALSGGAARGSFQLGAITALYEVYGFRPDLITGTSVGAINGILLAQAPPPAVNDPAAILAAVAAGVPDAGLAQLRVLQAEWATFLAVSDLFSVQPAFVGTPIANAAAGLAGSGASVARRSRRRSAARSTSSACCWRSRWSTSSLARSPPTPCSS
jgi:hypothetical protein